MPSDETPSDVRAPGPDHGASIGELGLRCELVDETLRGHATITPEMWLPGTTVVRTSVIATWADVLCGLIAGASFRPRVGVTLDLDVQIATRVLGVTEVEGVAYVVKAGRSVAVAAAEFRRDGAPFAFATASFMASPNPDHLAPEGGFLGARRSAHAPLSRPWADRVGIRRTDDGAVEAPYHLDNSNASRSLQGGIQALACEEASCVAAPGMLVTALSLRYLRPFRSGDAQARAEVHGPVARIRMTAGDRLGTIATARLEPI